MIAAGIAFAVGWAAIATLEQGFERKWRWLWIYLGQDFCHIPRAFRISAVLFPVEREQDLFGKVIDGFRFRLWFQIPRIYCSRPRLQFEWRGR